MHPLDGDVVKGILGGYYVDHEADLSRQLEERRALLRTIQDAGAGRQVCHAVHVAVVPISNHTQRLLSILTHLTR